MIYLLTYASHHCVFTTDMLHDEDEADHEACHGTNASHKSKAREDVDRIGSRAPGTTKSRHRNQENAKCQSPAIKQE